MKFSQSLVSGILIKRYKRFLADVLLDSGEEITAHCPNTGAMLGLTHPGLPVRLSYSNDPKRKLAYTLEMVYVHDTWIGCNTQNPNRIIGEALQNHLIPNLPPYISIRKEVKYGLQNSKIDFLLSSEQNTLTYVEVKNVHYSNNAEPHCAIFPDCVTERGTKHLNELIEMADLGHNAYLIYCVQRTDVTELRFGHEFDSVYATTARKALDQGVSMLAFSCNLTSEEITLGHELTIRRS
jgi:sugar fermentation stimulation protein A